MSQLILLYCCGECVVALSGATETNLRQVQAAAVWLKLCRFEYSLACLGGGWWRLVVGGGTSVDLSSDQYK